MLIKIPQGWELPESQATPESTLLNRRQILRAAGFLGAAGLLPAQAAAGLNFKKSSMYDLEVPVTEEWAATGYNNFYEFHPSDKEAAKNRVGKFQTQPWTIEVGGLVEKPKTYDLDDLMKRMPIEERLYRFRCVEAWAMAVPWVGFPMSALINEVQPKANAKFLRFVSVMRRQEQPGISEAPHYPWPYHEGLRMDEAMHPLSLFAVGMYGKAMPKQNGAPIRAIVPWKYGYKSAKSIVKIEFTAKQPPTFWNALQAAEYGFYSNVDPKAPHPRWSQAVERVIPNMGRRPTLAYNGYGKWVSGLYNGKEF